MSDILKPENQKDIFLADKADLPSYGGKTFSENLDSFKKKTEEVFNDYAGIFNRSDSINTFALGTLNEFFTPAQKISQLVAKIKAQKNIVEENYANVAEQMIEMKKLRRDMENETDDLEKELMSIKLLRFQNSLKEAQRLFEGSLKSVDDLYFLLQSQVKLMEEKYGGFNDEARLIDERRGFIMLAFANAVGDIRSTSRVQKGTINLFDQMGISFNQAIKRINEFFILEKNSDDLGNGIFLDWLETVADTFANCPGQKLEKLALPSEVNKETLFFKKEAQGE